MITWDLVWDFFPKIFVKLPLTLEIVVVSFISGLIIGFGLAVVRIKKIPVLNQIAVVFISYIRCTPIISQLFVVYFGLPMLLTSLGVDISSMQNVVYVFVAYGLNMAAFIGETIRSSILAVPAGQTEAGRSVGMTEAQTMLRIIIPQALHISMPVLGTIFVALFQASALSYMVGVIDMIGKAKSLGTIYGHTLEGYIDCAIVFAVISIVLEQVFKLLNSHLDYGKGRTARRRKA